eukprot:CAMPEP_0172026144 /NCGR_PEP_ID=MMETSP1041-20130122/16279_1 /TAXON_ID=464988 /ORGANISM="Hemiselmis andersenii, Strain CCMP439" /LENGTH=67 /DNA_ID=CAMNT_0012681897 /DNA_START=36 /DNA_END=236 /DNA_ORIENTATION=+
MTKKALKKGQEKGVAGGYDGSRANSGLPPGRASIPIHSSSATDLHCLPNLKKTGHAPADKRGVAANC